MCRACNKYSQVIEFANGVQVTAAVVGVAITHAGMFGKVLYQGIRRRVRYASGTCNFWIEV